MSMRILLYQGSFDPPHEGHLDCLVGALKFARAEKAVILANENNGWKPAMQPLQTRIEMLKILFKGEPRVEVAEESKEVVRKKLCERAYVIFLIGSDAWPRFSAKNEVPYPEICIVCRKENENPKIEAMAGKTITLFEQEKKGFSSTKVRELLNTHPEWYHQGVHSTSELPIPSSLRQYIFNRGLYCTAEREMRKAIEKSLLEKAKATFEGNLSLQCLNENDLGGLSGNLAYRVMGDAPLAFIKVYAREEGRKFFHQELRSLRLLEKLSLKQCKSVEQIYWEHEGTDFCHMAVSYIPEPDFGKVWKSKKNLKEMSFSIGCAMREFHAAKILRVDSNKGEISIQTTFDALRDYDKDVDELQARFFSVKGSSYNATYAHLDPNLGNFIVKNGTVYFIDLEKMGGSIGEKGEPIGHPEYDYYHFLRSLRMNQFFDPIDHFDEVEKGFISGYGPTADLFSPSIETFYKAICLLKEMLFYYQHHELEKATLCKREFRLTI